MLVELQQLEHATGCGKQLVDNQEDCDGVEEVTGYLNRLRTIVVFTV